MCSCLLIQSWHPIRFVHSYPTQMTSSGRLCVGQGLTMLLNKNNDKIIINHSKYTKGSQITSPNSFCPFGHLESAKLKRIYLHSVDFLCFLYFLTLLIAIYHAWFEKFPLCTTFYLNEIILNTNVVYFIVEYVNFLAKICKSPYSSSTGCFNLKYFPPPSKMWTEGMFNWNIFSQKDDFLMRNMGVFKIWNI